MKFNFNVKTGLSIHKPKVLTELSTRTKTIGGVTLAFGIGTIASAIHDTHIMNQELRVAAAREAVYEARDQAETLGQLLDQIPEDRVPEYLNVLSGFTKMQYIAENYDTTSVTKAFLESIHTVGDGVDKVTDLLN